MAWVWWLSGPVLATVLAACWSWLRSRPKPQPTTAESMAEHSEYLDALAQTARSRDRGLVADRAEPSAAESQQPDDAAA